MRYPVACERLKDLDDVSGWAETADEAAQLVEGKAATLEQSETRYTYKTMAEVDRYWRAEIASGVMQARQCWHGYVLDVNFWQVEV